MNHPNDFPTAVDIDFQNGDATKRKRSFALFAAFRRIYAQDDILKILSQTVLLSTNNKLFVNIRTLHCLHGSGGKRENSTARLVEVKNGQAAIVRSSVLFYKNNTELSASSMQE